MKANCARAVRYSVRGFRLLFTFPIHLYRKYLSRAKGTPTCRFCPTCSRYALDAVAEWGVLIGLALALWRVLRCNPFSAGGADPVPTNRIGRRLFPCLYPDGENLNEGNNDHA